MYAVFEVGTLQIQTNHVIGDGVLGSESLLKAAAFRFVTLLIHFLYHAHAHQCKLTSALGVKEVIVLVCKFRRKIHFCCCDFRCDYSVIVGKEE